MTGLEQAFYIMGIVFMGLGFVLLVAIVAAIFAIRAKINKIHDTIESKIDSISSVAERSGELTSIVSKQVLKQAKKMLSK